LGCNLTGDALCVRYQRYLTFDKDEICSRIRSSKIFQQKSVCGFVAADNVDLRLESFGDKSLQGSFTDAIGSSYEDSRFGHILWPD
jgi:hypothetical protein